MAGDDLRHAFLKHTEQELAEEKAAALKRIVDTLESSLAELDLLRARYASSCPAEKPGVAERYERTRARAMEYRWYLRVQCDAIGIRRHDHFDARYPEPGPL